MTALVDTPLRCGWRSPLSGWSWCEKPATAAVDTLAECGCFSTTYSCDDCPKVPERWTVCQTHQSSTELIWERRRLNEGDVPDDLTRQYVGVLNGELVSL